MLLSRLSKKREKKRRNPARDPEGNLMTLDNMKPERGMCCTHNTHIHIGWSSWSGVWASCAVPVFGGLTVPIPLQEESGQGIM